MTKSFTIIQGNMMREKSYSPYCGNDHCKYRGPRTKFNGNQMECSCGWKSSFDNGFIKEYKEKHNIHT